MTETEWLKRSFHWEPMLEDLRRRGSERQLLLLGCACCRRLWELLEDTGRATVEAVEHFADHPAGKSEVRRLVRLARDIRNLGWPSEQQRAAGDAVAALLNGEAVYRAAFAADHFTDERKAQFLLVEDIYGK